MQQELGFVLMPFGKKDAAGMEVDFEAIYHELIEPAIKEAHLEPHRADEKMNDGIIHKAMFERLILSRYAVADLTRANANVFYELDVRHGVRPSSTVSVFVEGARLPFGVGPLRGFPYPMTPGGTPTKIEESIRALSQRLRQARDSKPDSPIFQLVEGLPFTEPDHTKTVVFRDKVRYSNRTQELLAEDRRRKPTSAAIEAL